MEENQLKNTKVEGTAPVENINTAQNAKATQTKESLEEIANKKQIKLKFTDIIVPVALGALLIILAVFVFIPMISSTLKFADEYEVIRKKEEKLMKLMSDLNKIDDSAMQIDLVNAKDVIPKELTVSNFVFYIEDLAKDLNLSSKSLSGSDIKVASNEEDQNEQKYLGVSGPVAYSGSFENILKFLDNLYSASPYIVSASNVTIEREGVGTGMWKVSLNLTGYYVKEKESVVDIHRPLSIYSSYGEIVKIFEEKATKLKKGN